MPSASYCLKHLNDHELTVALKRLVRDEQRLCAQLLAHLAEVDARLLYLLEAAPSLFAYCVDVLKLSEDSAYKRINAARAARAYPVIFGLVAKGELHLSAVTLLAPHLTEANHHELCEAARGRSKRAVEQLVAERFPRPDAVTLLRRLPAPPAPSAPRLAVSTSSAAAAPALPGHAAPAASGAQSVEARASGSTSPSSPTPVSAALATEPSAAAWAAPASSPQERGTISPLAKDRYRLQITLSGATRDKLLRARELLLHKYPNGDLADVLDEALTRLCDGAERQKFGKLKSLVVCAQPVEPQSLESQPRPAEALQMLEPPAPGRVGKPTPANEHAAASSAGRPKSTGHKERAIPRAVKRAVAQRDGEQCTYVSPDGRRCTGRARLEYHHIQPVALGGETTVANVTLRCHAHHAAQTVLDFGIDAVRKRITSHARRTIRPQPGG